MKRILILVILMTILSVVVSADITFPTTGLTFVPGYPIPVYETPDGDLWGFATAPNSYNSMPVIEDSIFYQWKSSSPASNLFDNNYDTHATTICPDCGINKEDFINENYDDIVAYIYNDFEDTITYLEGLSPEEQQQYVPISWYEKLKSRVVIALLGGESEQEWLEGQVDHIFSEYIENVYGNFDEYARVTMTYNIPDFAEKFFLVRQHKVLKNPLYLEFLETSLELPASDSYRENPLVEHTEYRSLVEKGGACWDETATQLKFRMSVKQTSRYNERYGFRDGFSPKLENTLECFFEGEWKQISHWDTGIYEKRECFLPGQCFRDDALTAPNYFTRLSETAQVEVVADVYGLWTTVDYHPASSITGDILGIDNFDPSSAPTTLGTMLIVGIIIAGLGALTIFGIKKFKK